MLIVSVLVFDAITRLNVCVAVNAGALESVTCTVNDDVPATVGVPEIAPLPERLRPVFSVPDVIDHLYGVVPPVAPSVAPYAVPTFPDASEAVVIESGVVAAADIVRL